MRTYVREEEGRGTRGGAAPAGGRLERSPHRGGARCRSFVGVGVGARRPATAGARRGNGHRASRAAGRPDALVFAVRVVAPAERVQPGGTRPPALVPRLLPGVLPRPWGRASGAGPPVAC